MLSQNVVLDVDSLQFFFSQYGAIEGIMLGIV